MTVQSPGAGIPLVAGASVVLCANLDPAAVAKRTADERVTVTLA